MTGTAMLFPGQGEQRPGMLHRLPGDTDDVLAEAADTLGEEPLELDTESVLAGTRGAQLALLIAGTAWYRAAERRGLEADHLAGHSVGLWTAAVAARALDFAESLRLVNLRATAMHAASPRHAGMIVVDGPGHPEVVAAAVAVREAGHQVWPSNVNSPTQATASGTDDGLRALTDRLAATGARVRRLAVTVPAHCPLMTPAAECVRDALRTVPVRPPALPIAGNMTGQTIFTADKLRRELADSIEHGVRWDLATAILAERGVNRWIQIAPGRALIRLVPSGAAYAMADVGLDQLIRRLVPATESEKKQQQA
ncbi:acyltransferase domain-containing protein [Micromonospora sp. NPDC047707]|uniref:ACP S-malonyltransferase n=1 Tax=Micromonospora sp. NPDC047707 TaxID=3154498 RepID=UPI003451F26C